jgi:hypothetical protein
MTTGAEVRWSEKGFEVCCDGHGFKVSGDGFTVWDEKLHDALEAARMLRLPGPHRRPPEPTERAALFGTALAPGF